MITSIVISRIGSFGLYYFTAGCGGTLGIIVLCLRNKLPRNCEEQVPYIPKTRTSPEVSNIDPRGKHEVQYDVEEMSECR